MSLAPTLVAPIITTGSLDKELNYLPNGHTVEFFVNDGQLKCMDPCVIDYYKVNNEGHDIGSWIHEKLEKWANDNGWYWEWDNAECISLSW